VTKKNRVEKKKNRAPGKRRKENVPVAGPHLRLQGRDRKGKSEIDRGTRDADTALMHTQGRGVHSCRAEGKPPVDQKGFFAPNLKRGRTQVLRKQEPVLGINLSPIAWPGGRGKRQVPFRKNRRKRHERGTSPQERKA